MQPRVKKKSGEQTGLAMSLVRQALHRTKFSQKSAKQFEQALVEVIKALPTQERKAFLLAINQKKSNWQDPPDFIMTSLTDYLTAFDIFRFERICSDWLRLLKNPLLIKRLHLFDTYIPNGRQITEEKLLKLSATVCFPERMKHITVFKLNIGYHNYPFIFDLIKFGLPNLVILEITNFYYERSINFRRLFCFGEHVLFPRLEILTLWSATEKKYLQKDCDALMKSCPQLKKITTT